MLFLHRKTFHEFDGYHTKANTELGEEEEKDKSFISTQLEIHKMLYKKKCLWERVFFSVILYCERSQVYTFDQFT